MKLISLYFLIFILMVQGNASAYYDPSSVPNNKFGIHILEGAELKQASELVNSTGGDWGYITIPIQATDRNLEKWQKFMDDARSLHLIPIVRIATEGDFFNTVVWRKPTNEDVLDFANFLDSLNWPTKNRYITIYNEVNRSDEWGGKVSPSEYANILNFAVTVFKSRSSDFYILSAGMDNASSNNNATDMNEYTYFYEMNQAVPGIFNQIDGISSHSYPNPNFSQPAQLLSSRSIDTFRSEQNYIQSLSGKKPNVFITETGWRMDTVSKESIGNYFNFAFSNVWNDPSVIAVTPFLLKAGSEPFSKFSLISEDGSPNQVYEAIRSLAKTKGAPIPSDPPKVLSGETVKNLPLKDYSDEESRNQSKLRKVESVLKVILNI